METYAAYESLQAILEEAGMSHQQLAEKPYGSVDGTNRIFTTPHKPLSDRNYDDVVDINDVFVLVNGAPATVESIDAINGVITLVNAPAADVEVLVDYRYSPIPLSVADTRRREAQDYINQNMKRVDPCAPYTGAFNPGNGQTLIDNTIRTMVRLYAAGLLLVRDYGFNQDTELTSKDGYKKLEMVTGASTRGKFDPGMLDAFMAIGGVCGGDNEEISTGGIGAFETSSDGSIFDAFDDTARPDSELNQSCGDNW